MKKYLIILFLSLFLISCGGDSLDDNNSIDDDISIKSDFLIDVKKFGDFNNEVGFKKSGKITGVGEFDVNSQANGRINKLNFKQGDKVREGDIILTLSDSVSNYYLGLERARNNLERAEINFESNIISLDKAIEESRIALNSTESSHKTLIKELEERIKKARFDLEQTRLSSTDSTASLDISKMESDLSKAQLDFENSLVSDNNQLSQIHDNIYNIYKSLDVFYFDSMNFLDEIFGVSDKNKNMNNSFEIYLSARNSSLKSESENLIRELLIDYKDFSKYKNLDINSDNADELIGVINSSIILLKNTIDKSKDAVINSVKSSTFPQSRIDQIYQNINGYSNNLNTINSNFLQIRNNYNSFLNTIDSNIESRQKSIEILKEQINIAKRQSGNQEFSLENALNRTIIEAENSIINSKNSLESAKLAYENAKKNREVNARSLQNAIEEARVAVREANTNIANLTVRSPVTGVINNLFVDRGQTVSNGTPLFNIVNYNDTEIELFLTRSELNQVKLGDSVNIVFSGNKIDGKISKISSIATPDFTFRVIVDVLEDISIIGDFVEIEFLTQSEKYLLPVGVVNVLSEGIGKIFIYNELENSSIQKQVELGEMFGEMIEIKNGVERDDLVILTNMDNFIESDFELKLR